MQTDRATILCNCPKCGNQVVIDQIWYPGGTNDYGSFDLECLKCKHTFNVDVGRDVDASGVRSGARNIKKK